MSGPRQYTAPAAAASKAVFIARFTPKQKPALSAKMISTFLSHLLSCSGRPWSEGAVSVPCSCLYNRLDAGSTAGHDTAVKTFWHTKRPSEWLTRAVTHHILFVTSTS